MIYEARPNVTYDVFSLCFKSGNACVLKGGRDANASNSAGVELIHKVLITFGIDPNVVTLLPATHEATGEMLNAVGYIDLCIPHHHQCQVPKSERMQCTRLSADS